MPSAPITGIASQDGRCLSELLLAKGYDGYGLIRGQEATVPSVTLLTGDVTDPVDPGLAPGQHPSETRGAR